MRATAALLFAKLGCVIVCELRDQTSARSKADKASPRRIIDQSPASRPKRRVTVIATEAVSAATPDFLKATGTVFSCCPIFVPVFHDAAKAGRNKRQFLA